jgi:hypothetical protein
MVLDPSQVSQVVRQALTAGPTDTRGEDARSRQAQLSFSAMLSAVQSGCPCEACQLLREATDSLRVRPRSQESAHGPGIDPSA